MRAERSAAFATQDEPLAATATARYAAAALLANAAAGLADKPRPVPIRRRLGHVVRSLRGVVYSSEPHRLCRGEQQLRAMRVPRVCNVPAGAATALSSPYSARHGDA